MPAHGHYLTEDFFDVFHLIINAEDDIIDCGKQVRLFDVMYVIVARLSDDRLFGIIFLRKYYNTFLMRYM